MDFFNKETGMIAAFRFQGKEIIEEGPVPNFWRPITDNDFGNKMHQKNAVWRQAGKKRRLTGFRTKKMKGAVQVETAFKLPDVNSELFLTYHIVKLISRIFEGFFY